MFRASSSSAVKGGRGAPSPAAASDFGCTSVIFGGTRLVKRSQGNGPFQGPGCVRSIAVAPYLGLLGPPLLTLGRVLSPNLNISALREQL